ncbi:histidine phosphotransferase family protein, partial [Paracraurococcus ruber]
MRMDTQLARLLAARLCHDLGGVTGTLTGTLDLVQGPQDEMLGLAQEAAAGLRDRLRLYAAAWGGTTGDAEAAALARLLEASPASPRVRFDLGPLSPGRALPAVLVPVLLNAGLLAAEALPRGGLVMLSGGAEDGIEVRPEGRDAAWPAGLQALLRGGTLPVALQEGPRRVVAPFLLLLPASAASSSR